MRPCIFSIHLESFLKILKISQKHSIKEYSKSMKQKMNYINRYTTIVLQ